MMRAQIDDALLNAYVDRELPADEAARIALLVAQDGAIARRVAHLQELKAALSMVAADVTVPPFPECRPYPAPRVSRQPARRLRLALLVAAAAAVGVVGMAGWMQRSAPTGHGADLASAPVAQVPAHFSAIIAVHDAWIDAPPDAEMHRIASAAAPDWMSGLMAANGLRLVHNAKSARGSASVWLHYGFTGANNCRLSLFELPAGAGGSKELILNATGSLQTARWHLNGIGYAMIARDMNRARFATVAASVHAATQTRSPDSENLIAAMATARQRCTV